MTKNAPVAISSLGNPKSAKTWSGTPKNICDALESLNITVFGIDSSIKNKYQRRVYWLLHKVFGLGTHDYARGRFARNNSASLLQVQCKAVGCKKVLHTGTLDLPIAKLDREIEHYLYCDYTWDLWMKNATDIQQYTPRMLQLAEELEQESYSQIKHFFPISNYVKENLINHYQINPNQITVVGTGRGNIEPFTSKKDYSNGTILFVAKERFADKGGFLLLEGFKIAQRDNPALKLVIVGREEYRELIGSSQNVRVTGYITWEELQNLFNTAALFAMPALNEPWGLVYLEALACKTPILGLNRNALPEITDRGKYGFLVNEITPNSIAEGILDAFSDLERLQSMGEAGHNFCLNTFSWKQVANKISNVMLETKF